MKRAVTVVSLLCAFAVIPAASAMEPYLPKSAQSFGKADANADGKVTAAEIGPRAERRFTRMDADKNGEVTAAEIDEALKRALERRRGRIMAKLDADKNGTISRAELDRAVEEMIAAADADHDGGVTLAEAQNFRLAKIKKPATGEQSN